MLMFNEEAIILDRLAKGLDLVCNLGSMLEERVQGKVSLVTAIVEELDGTWVAIMINVSPASFNSLHSLVSFPIKVDFFTWYDQVDSWESTLRLRSYHRKKWNTTNSPKFSGRSNLLGSDTQSCQTVLNQYTCGEPISGSNWAIEQSGMWTSSLISEIVSYWSKTTFIFCFLLSLLKLLINKVRN